ncbi:uncharacterized protein LOC132794461 [Drosophila nasuta]|uniref:uncharacterized protein LOC132794461 n=1 Tax=Drosophila nasuta TaxID=42062 RepID=UPI00295F0A1A|nr:uncharacterized protein LOC132794461 [Drosophila nasuta]XP_060660908.1 uncharacterized protein LOC132794461 [Drosophila nasuta]XP_060660909.1 uncharacterized protein LOC132794461 [Drosophila nasuta]
MDVACVCCRCGTLQAGATATLCLPVTGTQNSFHCHCFCCAQPPRMKCFYCNMPRDLGPLESHGTCLPDKLHVFVNTEQWPPFSVNTPQPPLIGMVVTLGNGQEMQQLPDNVDDDNEVHEMEEADYIEEEDDFNTMHAIGIVKTELQESSGDVKPRISTKSKWVSIGDIRKWTSCIRCGMVKIKSDGWIKHAQKCGQDPKFASRKFFIYLHTLSWCNTLVNDNFWEQHSNAVNGKCKICRSSRLNKEPLPYQPKPPTRKNEKTLSKQWRSRILKKRIKRKQSMAADVPNFQNSANNNAPMRIVECISLRQND